MSRCRARSPGTACPSKEQVGQLREICQRGEDAVRAGDTQRFVTLSNEVHSALPDIAGTSVLADSLRSWGAGPAGTAGAAVANGGLNCSSPAVANGVVYNGFDGVLAKGASTGQQLFWFNARTRCDGSAAVANGVAYIACDDGPLYAVNAATGAVLWHGQIPSKVNPSSPAVAAGVLYVGSGSKQMFAFAPAG